MKPSPSDTTKIKSKLPKDEKVNEEADTTSEELTLLLAYIHSVYDYIVARIEEYKTELNAASVFDGTNVESSDSSCSGGQDKESEEENYMNEMMELQFGKRLIEKEWTYFVMY